MKSRGEGFEPIRNLLLADPTSAAIYQKVVQNLNRHGIQDVGDILKYCTSEDNGTDGATSQDSDIVAVRIKIGNTFNKWDQAAQEKLNKAYAFKVVSLPFLEFLIIADRPSICIKTGETILSAYVILVHEFIHFLYHDPIETKEVVLKLEQYNDFLTYSLFNKGGEIEAYRQELGVVEGEELFGAVPVDVHPVRPAPPVRTLLVAVGD